MATYPPAPAGYPRGGGSFFTLIEATVVITVLALLAALVVPNVVAMQRSQAVRTLEQKVLRLPAEALNEARRNKKAVTLRAEGSDTLVLEQAGDDGTEPTEFKRLTLSADLRLDAAHSKGESVALASWEWTVYPDGSATPGRLDLAEGTKILSLRLPENGELPRWSTANSTEAGDERWSAGELEQRG